MPVPTARVWRRYGHLRIYVSAGEAELGWYDPRSGRFQLHQRSLAEDFWTAVHAECRRLSQEGRLAASPPRRAPAGTQPIVQDSRRGALARNKPGESAQARARELRARHPFMVTAAQAVGIRTEAGSFAAGARGEREVGRKLNRWAAGHGWHVLHAVLLGQAGADIDHVVIASFGVVTVNTKATRTTVWVGEHGMAVGGKAVDYLRKSRTEGRRASRLLTRRPGGLRRSRHRRCRDHAADGLRLSVIGSSRAVYTDVAGSWLGWTLLEVTPRPCVGRCRSAQGGANSHEHIAYSWVGGPWAGPAGRAAAGLPRAGPVLQP